jgi:hypothetical protein
MPSQIGTLLGTMRADRTFAGDAFRAEWAANLPGTLPPSESGLWLVFRWEGLNTVSSFPAYPQDRNWFDIDGRAMAKARKSFVKTAAQRCLETVGWLHANGVVHRSLGGASLILSTYDQRVLDGRLAVKAIDLGFAATASRLQPEEVAHAMQRGARSPVDVLPFLARADDLHAMAYVLLELILGSAPSPPEPRNPAGVPSLFGLGAQGADDSASGRPAPPSADIQSLKRLVEDVFGGDVCGEFRDYCTQETAWGAAVALLDEGDRSGWTLIQSLVACREAASHEAESVSCAQLLESEWFRC